MTASARTLHAPWLRVVQSGAGVLRLMDALRDEAALEIADALDGISTKRITAARVDGASAYGLSRAANGDASNPLFRIVALFVLFKRLGLGRERALKIHGWLREVIDALWPEEETDVAEALEQDSAVDPADDHLRFQAALGCTVAAAELIAVKRVQIATAQTTIAALRRMVPQG